MLWWWCKADSPFFTTHSEIFTMKQLIIMKIHNLPLFWGKYFVSVPALKGSTPPHYCGIMQVRDVPRKVSSGSLLIWFCWWVGGQSRKYKCNSCCRCFQHTLDSLLLINRLNTEEKAGRQCKVFINYKYSRTRLFDSLRYTNFSQGESLCGVA